MISCQCNGCTGILHPDEETEKKGRKNVFKCGKCQCTYGFVVITRTPKCCGLEIKKKKKFIRGLKGEKIDVSVDNEKLQKLADTSVPVLLTTPLNTEMPKRKRGRPPKNVEKVVENV